MVQVLHEDVCALLASLEQVSEIEHEVVEEADVVERQAKAGAAE